MKINITKAYFHLPGLFEFYPLYEVFLPLFFNHREYFYDWCEVASVYGAPSDCIWGGGREEISCESAEKVLSLVNGYGISAVLTFSNSLLMEEHLNDAKCNEICRIFDASTQVQNGVIVASDLLTEYLQNNYKNLYLVSSTTKVLTEPSQFLDELKREDFKYVCPDFRLNKSFDFLNTLPQTLKDKTEFLCNECCAVTCTDRKKCYESVSAKMLGLESYDHKCHARNARDGYRFSSAMENPAFIGISDIKNIYMPAGFSHFKIEGRSLGSALILEFLLYYLTKPEYQLKVREEIYLDSMLDLF